ncbi:hypothetical protein M5V91_11125 [Cytobacillus pseudoceanisediminis]|uniref:hypothetical protein n=1 Tax=Cytobacillus pseudoceanisediminis TaxID=3051614 RepID=UPI002188D08D|nr:hypothetical protein [Cytobacillus pseudoceanisediminis]UQX56127.1 hypothetical protein M5V91_11125 [Cytobacillus pseudoceanisediminis]
MEPIKTFYIFNRVVFRHGDGISELTSVTKESWVDNIVTPEVLCSSLNETPFNKASKELKSSIGVVYKEHITEEQAYALVVRFEKEGKYSY